MGGGVDETMRVQFLLLLAWRHLRIMWMRKNPTKAICASYDSLDCSAVLPSGMKKVEISLLRPTDEEASVLMKSVLMSQSPVVDLMLSWSRLPRVVGTVIIVVL